MSTRATYKIIENHVTTTFYIHHDGYPAGAAVYFQAMLDYNCEAPNAGMADRFIRANARAELADGHDAHGDTDYQYTIKVEGDNDKIKMNYYRCQGASQPKATWLADFILNELSTVK